DLLIFLTFPAAISAIRCYDGLLSSESDLPLSKMCTSDFCSSMEGSVGNKKRVVMSCGRACTSEGIDPATGLFCCKFDFCNGADGANQCYVGSGMDDVNVLYKPLPCPSGFCYKTPVVLGTKSGEAKDCAHPSVCSSTGKEDNGGYCCNGNLCNAASGSSLLMT
ncbi:hypothetical protein PMAYCL1PPCAC_20896, partial [Pristionchus mayeri]